MEIAIFTGEASGSLYARYIIRRLQELYNGEISLWGIGDKMMEDVGFSSFWDINELSVVGLFEAIGKFPRILKIRQEILREVFNRKPQVALYIDSPGFNINLAHSIKNGLPSIKNVYLVSPQIWAWKYKRIYKLRKCVDLMLLLYEFEKEIYDKEGIPNVVVGHPILDSIDERLNVEKRDGDIILPEEKIRILFLPGSRESEIRYHLPIFLNIAKRVQDGNFYFFLSYANRDLSSIINSILGEEGVIDVFYNKTLSAIEKADIVVTASGTVTLEVAYFGKPMIIVYRVNPLTFFLAKRVVKIPYIGMVNILHKKFIVKEFLQNDFNERNVINEIYRILEDDNYREEMIRNLLLTKRYLGDGKASYKIAYSILSLFKGM
jgi:lipid-A-disaccharide synthase